ncbi:MAG: hydroxymethylbilane synthase [Devosia sp.]
MQSPPPFLRIGTRGSPLALAQAHQTRDRLSALHGVEPERIAIIPISTGGDRLTDVPLSAFGGKGLFSREIEAALAEGIIDIGVHSSKDMATTLPPGLVMPVFLEREDVRDAFISLGHANLESLPEGALFGTSSIRRAAQILRARPDLAIVPFRGNVQTRLRKLGEGVAEATLLAGAGLNRLDMADRIRHWLDPEIFLPAPAQGAIGIEHRADDHRTADIVAPLNHPETARAVKAERAMLQILDGSCRTPIGALTTWRGPQLMLVAELVSPDGRITIKAEGPLGEDTAQADGAAVGRMLKDRAGPDFVKVFSR